MKKTTCIAVLLLLTFICCAAEKTPFRWFLSADGNSCKITLQVDTSGVIYADSVTIKVTDADGKKLKPENIPAAAKDQDGTTVYPAGVWVWSFSGKPPFSATVESQGCGKDADGSQLCYAPETLTLTEQAQKSSEKEKINQNVANKTSLKLIRSTSGYMSKEKFLSFLGDVPSVQTSSNNYGIAAIFLIALLGGLGLNLTPCILPMIPINLAIIGASGSSRKTGFLRGLLYGSGMAFAYGVLGVVVVLSGAPFGSLNSSSIFNFIIAGVFLVLAAAMAGFINFDLTKFRRINPSKISGVKEITAFIMGAVSALLAGACVAPVVVTVLLFSSSSYNDGHIAALFLPFVLGIGMALPWPFAGAGLAVLPRPNGKAMNTVKMIFVILIACAAAYYAYLGCKLLPSKSSDKAEFAKLNAAISESARSGKPVLIDFWATWCKNCSAMEKEVLSDPEVKKAMEKFTFIKFDAGNISSPEIAALLEQCNIPGLPGYAIVAMPDDK